MKSADDSKFGSNTFWRAAHVSSLFGDFATVNLLLAKTEFADSFDCKRYHAGGTQVLSSSFLISKMQEISPK